MLKGEYVLAIVPARGGSKRVPRKNLRAFRGTPLLQLAYDCARASKYIDRVILSTDDEEIRATAAAIGYEYLLRPAELATDEASSEDVMRHVLGTNRIAGSPDYAWIVLLQLTSPLRTVADVDACIERAQLGHGCVSTHMGRPNGAVYVATADWLAAHDFSHAGLCKHEMPEERSLDLDNPEDFEK